MKKTKTQKGITLIALIITIIVLLILAVVAINAIQNDGIIEHAKNARESYQTAQRNEQAILDSYLSKLQDDKANPPSGGNDNDNNDTPTLEGTPCTACSYGYLNEYEAFVCSSCGSRSDDGCSGYELIRCETHGIQIHDTSWGADYNYECPVCKVPGTFLRDMGGNYLCANCYEYTSVLPIRCPFKCTYGVIYGTAVALMGEDSVNVRDTIELTVKKNDGTTIAAEDFIWDSSDKTLATVSNGVVTGVKALEVENTSKTTITATSKTDSSVVATKEITVKPLDCPDCTYGYLSWDENALTICKCGKIGTIMSWDYLCLCHQHGYFEAEYCTEGNDEAYCPECELSCKSLITYGVGVWCDYGCDTSWRNMREKCQNNCTYGGFYE